MNLSWMLGALWLAAAAPDPKMDSFEDCDALRRKDADSRLGHLCYYRHGRLANALPEARDRLAFIVESEPDNAWAKVFLANATVDLGDRVRGTELTREGVAALVARDDVSASDKAVLELDFATMLRAQGLNDEALEHFSAAEAHASRTSRPALHAMTQLELADTRVRVGSELAPLRQLVDDALPVVLEEGEYVMKLKALLIAANVASAAGDKTTAIAHRERAREIAEDRGDAYVVAGLLATIANLRVTTYDPRLAWADPEPFADAARVALEASKAADNGHGEAVALCALGAIEPSPQRAVEHFRRCLAAHERSGYFDGAFSAKTYLAERLAALGPEHAEEALRIADELVKAADASGELETRMRARFISAEARWRVGRHAEGVEAAREVIELVELVRDVHVDTGDRTHALARYAFPYYLLSGTLLANPARTPEDLELAFATMERLRARTLVEQLALESAEVGPNLDDPRFAQRRAVLIEIARTQRRLIAAEAGSDTHTALFRQVEALETRERALRTELARDDPRFASLRAPEPPRLAEVSSALAADEAILAFQLADDRDHTLADEGGAWVLVITAQGVASHRIAERWLMARRVPMLSSLVVQRDPAAVRGLVSLHDALVADAIASLPASVERLVIVPDGVLYDVPFAALRAEPDGATLAERFELTLTPSVTHWLRWRDIETPSRPGLLAIADDNASAQTVAVARAGVLDTLGNLGALPGAEDEAQLVAELHGEGTVRTGDAATESFLKSTALADYGVLHVAAHAFVDHDAPERSGVVLRPGGPDEDGLLQAREIAELDLDGKVVVLSTCSGLAGSPVRGEGLMSLSRAFLLAGAQAVVASRYPLRDADAQLLFARLYHHIGTGRTLAGALAMARRDLIAAGAPEAAWAGVVVLGNGDVVLRPRSPWERRVRRLGFVRVATAAGALLLALFGLIAARRAAHSNPTARKG